MPMLMMRILLPMLSENESNADNELQDADADDENIIADADI